MGACSDEQGGLYFEASFQGDKLMFNLIEVGWDTMPDYNSTQMLTFSRQKRGTAKSTAPPAGATAPEKSGTAPAAPTQARAGEITDPMWGFAFLPPEGWIARASADGAVLGHNTVAGMILVLPHQAADPQAMRQEMQQGLQEEGTVLYPDGNLQNLSENVIAGDYSGFVDGQKVKARGLGASSPHGGGAYIIGVTTPEAYGKNLVAAAESLARGLRYVKMDASQVMAFLAGAWSTVSEVHKKWLGANGEYAERFESVNSGNFTDAWSGEVTGNWGYMSEDAKRGRWTARGTKERGTIIVTYQDGTQNSFEYHVFVEKGQPFWNEYIIDGNHYVRQKE